MSFDPLYRLPAEELERQAWTDIGHHTRAAFVPATGAPLPFADGTFDLVLSGHLAVHLFPPGGRRPVQSLPLRSGLAPSCFGGTATGLLPGAAAPWINKASNARVCASGQRSILFASQAPSCDRYNFLYSSR